MDGAVVSLVVVFVVCVLLAVFVAPWLAHVTAVYMSSGGLS